MAGFVRLEPAAQYRSFHRIMIFPASGGPAIPEQRVCWWESSTLFLLSQLDAAVPVSLA